METTGVRFSSSNECPALIDGKRNLMQGYSCNFSFLIPSFMKILAIDIDSERLNALKSLEPEGHLIQSTDDLSGVTEFLDRSFCQILALGAQQVTGDALKVFSSWHQSLPAETSPFTVVLESLPVETLGIDHTYPVSFDPVDAMELTGLRGIPSEPEAFDYKAALEICGDDPDLFLDIADIFLKDGSERIKHLTQRMETGNWPQVRESAHLMKGSALNLSADPLRLACQGLEQMAAAGSTHLIPLWFEQLIYEYGRLKVRLQGLTGGPAERP